MHTTVKTNPKLYYFIVEFLLNSTGTFLKII
jgi:hypothetical protein